MSSLADKASPKSHGVRSGTCADWCQRWAAFSGAFWIFAALVVFTAFSGHMPALVYYHCKLVPRRERGRRRLLEYLA